MKLPCARSHSNVSKLDAVLIKQCFTQCLVARREEKEGRKKEREKEREQREERTSSLRVKLPNASVSVRSVQTMGNVSKVCSQIARKCLHLARLGRLHVLWSVDKVARAVTKWTRACDKRFARVISYTHYTSHFRQYCQVGHTAEQCRLGLFQDTDVAGDLDSESTSGGILCTFGSRTSVPLSWMCKKRSSGLQSTTESEVISSDAGLRMDGIPALKLWDYVTDILQSSSPSSVALGDPMHCVRSMRGVPGSDRSGSSEQDDCQRQKSNKETCFSINLNRKNPSQIR